MSAELHASGHGAGALAPGSRPLRPAKRYRSDSDDGKQIVRCKRRLNFIAGAARGSSGSEPRRGGSGGAAATSIARRNERERKRVSLINRTFELLRDQLPTSLWGQRNLAKVSKVETLRAAIGYIRTLEDLLAADDDGSGCAGEQLVDALGSAERLACLATSEASLATGDDDRGCYSVDVSSLSTSDTAAAAACSRLDLLSAAAAAALPSPASEVTDLHDATRRLAQLASGQPLPNAAQHSPYLSTGHVPPLLPWQQLDSNVTASARADDDVSSLLLDINSNYDSFRRMLSVKPSDNDALHSFTDERLQLPYSDNNDVVFSSPHNHYSSNSVIL